MVVLGGASVQGFRGALFHMSEVPLYSEQHLSRRPAAKRDGNNLQGLIDSGLGGVPQEQRMIKRHLLRVMYHKAY